MRIIQLGQTKIVTVTPAVTKSLSEVTLLNFSDDGESVIATIQYGTSKPVKKVLLEGQAYINAGQYTDNDIDNLIKAL